MLNNLKIMQANVEGFEVLNPGFENENNMYNIIIKDS